MPMYALYRSIVETADSCGVTCTLTYSDIHRSVSGFFVNLKFDVTKAFSCPNHGTSPKWIVSDGKAVGPLKRRLKHLKELDVAPDDNTVLTQSTFNKDRIFLSNKTERDLVCKLLSGEISMDEFCNSDEISSDSGTLLKNLVSHIKELHPLKIPEAYVPCLRNISKNSSARSLLQVNNTEH